MLSSSLAAIQADNAQLPAGLELIPLWFNGLVAGTAPTRRKAIFVAPFDLIVESVAVQAADFTNPSTLTVTITGDGPLVNWPISVSGLHRRRRRRQARAAALRQHEDERGEVVRADVARVPRVPARLHDHRERVDHERRRGEHLRRHPRVSRILRT
jgi:hypothetical protein